ncbi:hypothetical protein STEG23_004721 [Scotinomys teguina]
MAAMLLPEMKDSPLLVQKTVTRTIELQESISKEVSNNVKYLDVTLTKQVKGLYDKNFKSLKKEIGEDIRRWKELPCSWTSGVNI